MNPFRWHPLIPSRMGAFTLFMFALLFACVTQAQTTGTRATDCDPATPNNALCVKWTGIAVDTNGNAITGVTYRVQQRLGTAGNFATVSTGQTGVTYYAKNLAVATYYFQVYAACTACTAESAGSNVASGASTAVQVVPATPVIIIAATIRANGPPIYRIIQSVNLRPSEVVMVAPASWRPLFQ